MELSESIRFIATELDKAGLVAIARKDGDTSMSATIRRLIREELKRRNIEPVTTPSTCEPQQTR